MTPIPADDRDTLFPPLPEVPAEAYRERLDDWPTPIPADDPLREALESANDIIRMMREHLTADHPDCPYAALGVLNDATRNDVARLAALQQPAHPEPLTDEQLATIENVRSLDEAKYLLRRLARTVAALRADSHDGEGLDVEVRPNDDGTIDEVLIAVGGVNVFHMEQMDDDAYWFAIYPPGSDERWSFWMHRKGKRLLLTVNEQPALSNEQGRSPEGDSAAIRAYDYETEGFGGT